MKLNALDEGLADYAIIREEQDAREAWIAWAVIVAGAGVAGVGLGDCDLEDCGFLDDARRELVGAHRRARLAGVLDDQPGEAEWLTMHRWERED